MASFFIANTLHSQQRLTSIDVGFIGVNGALIVNSDNAIDASGFNELTVLGIVAATGYRGSDAFVFDGIHGRVMIGSSGHLHSAWGAAITVSVDVSFDIINHGTISSEFASITLLDINSIAAPIVPATIDVVNHGSISSTSGSGLVAGSGSSIIRLVNTGDITAGSDGVNVVDTGSVFIENSGQIIGGFGALDYGYESSVSNSQKIYNTGLISGGAGAIRFDSGTNLYDGTGGQVIGDILGGSGVDTIIGGSFAETVDGGAGNDVIYGKGGDDTLNGGDDSDAIYGNSGDDVLNGGNGRDMVRGGAGADELDGGGGAEDWLDYRGSTARVVVNLGTGQADGGDAAGDTFAGFERIIGSSLNDTLTGDSGNNVIRGDNDADFIRGASGNDLISGGKGGDKLDGGNGIDTLDYRMSAAAVSINLASNRASGGDADGDTITRFENFIGSAFDDKIIASKVANQMTGGAGDDTFHFRSNLGPNNVDTITDFTAGTDTIELEDAIFTAIAQSRGPMLSGYFKANKTGTATDANDRIVYDTNSGELYYDADGSGGGASVQFAQMSGLPALTFNDFDVV